MNRLRTLIIAMEIIVACAVVGVAQTPAAKAPSSTARPSAVKPKSPAMREPFTLLLKIDKDNYDEFHYGKQPYV